MSYVSLKNLSHFSLRHSIQKPEALVKKAKSLGMSALALTDNCSLAGSMEFASECKSNDIKPIFGLKLHTNSGYITVVAQNKTGWNNLIKLVTKSNLNFVGELPTTTLSMLQDHAAGLIAICGAKNSIIANSFVSPDNEVDSSYTNEVANLALNLNDIFDKRFYLDLDGSSNERLKAALLVIGEKTNIPWVKSSESIFASPTDIEDYRILACTDRRCTLKELGELYENRYFRSENELGDYPDNSQLVADMCEKYDITNKPKLPRFACPPGLSEREYLHQLVYASPRFDNSDAFKDRLNMELPVLASADLEGYFLIVNEYTNYAKSLGCLASGRGSAAGSLVSYLLGLTNVNPLKYNLLFERFYNPGRNTKDHISYPDIDMDFPVDKREQIIEHIKDTYGRDRVSQMITFGRLQGAGALKEVLRAHSACDVNTMNRITEEIPEESKIADDLENDDEDSIIRWTLHNRPKVVEDYARINEAGEIVGDYGQYFEQAIRIEGVYRTSGKHAAGIVIAPEPLEDICPMVMDNKHENLITGWEMKAVEKAGLIKMDILGLAALDKLQYARDLIRGTI